MKTTKSIYADWTREELEALAEDYSVLCAWLHCKDEEIGLNQKLIEDLHDMVYKRLEP